MVEKLGDRNTIFALGKNNGVRVCPRNECKYLVRATCALSVEFHVQRLGYIRPQSYTYRLYYYVFDAGPNKHDILIGLSLPQKSQHSHTVTRRRTQNRNVEVCD